MTQQARFTHMQDGTEQDWAIIAGDFQAYARQLPDRVLAHLSRWQFFTGWSRDATNRDSDPYTASVAGEENIGALPTSTAASDAF